MSYKVKSITACLAALLFFIIAFYLAIHYLISFFKFIAVILLIISLSHVIAKIISEWRKPDYES
jgi:hypothetical protein